MKHEHLFKDSVGLHARWPRSQEHDAGHAGHSHGGSADADARKLGIALVVILGFTAFELVVGLERVEILSAEVNGVTLLVLAVLITIEAVRRLFTPLTSVVGQEPPAVVQIAEGVDGRVRETQPAEIVEHMAHLAVRALPQPSIFTAIGGACPREDPALRHE